MQPMVARIRQTYPAALITVMAPGWCLGLLSRMPGVDKAIENPFGHGALLLKERFRLGRSLAGQFDRCYVLPNSLKSALVPWFAQIKQRIGFVGEFRHGLLNDARRLDKIALPRMVERFAVLAEAPDVTKPAHVPNPVLSSSTEQQTAALNKLGLDLNRPALTLCPGAEYGPAKRWPTRHFAAVAQAAIDKGWQVWILGSNKDESLAQEIIALTPTATNLCGKTSLEDAIDLLAHSRAAITNDSGLMHIAAAVGTELIAIYGSSSPGFTPPLSEKAVIRSLNLECSPCFKRECPLGHTRCLNDMNPEQIIQFLPLGTLDQP